jgi:Flp pilus assembly protein TadG
VNRAFFGRVAWSGLCRIQCLGDDAASQIVEFAVALPLIAFFVMGIFDFSQAYGVKQKLINAAREGARIGANQPTQDLSTVAPATITAIGEAVGQSLKTSGLDDCGLATGAWVSTVPGTLAWTLTASGASCTAAEPVVEIERGVLTTVTMSAPYPAGTMDVENTRVTVQYPYTWRFGKAASLVVPGSTFNGPTTLQAVATMQNLN